MTSGERGENLENHMQRRHIFRRNNCLPVFTGEADRLPIDALTKHSRIGN
jgi:hypothetical protein